jgi:enoyl-CoA hydratase/carnithine racemase
MRGENSMSTEKAAWGTGRKVLIAFVIGWIFGGGVGIAMMGTAFSGGLLFAAFFALITYSAIKFFEKK